MVNEKKELNLEFGSGPNVQSGYTGVDWKKYPGVEYVVDLETIMVRPDFKKMPFKDNSVDKIRIAHCMEHIDNPLQVIEEFNRILKPGGHLKIIVPYFAHPVSHTPLHKNYWGIQGSLLLFHNEYFETTVKWKNLKVTHTWGSTHPLRNAVNFLGQVCIDLFGYYIYERTLGGIFPIFELIFDMDKE